jgi:hypothetical protein
MAGKKKPKEEHGVRTQFRLKKREIKELDHFTEQCNFENRTELIKWCLQLGLHVFKEDTPELLVQLQRFNAQQNGEITDPRQKDLFQEFQMKASIKAQQAILDVKHELLNEGKEMIESLNQ